MVRPLTMRTQTARKVYGLYVDVASNPFFELGGPVQSARFENMVAAIVVAYNS